MIGIDPYYHLQGGLVLSDSLCALPSIS